MSEADDRLERRTRAVFDESVDALDGATRSRLTQARHAAVAELRGRPRWLTGWLPAGALAAAALVAVTLWSGRETGVSPAGGTPVAFAFEDLELVTAGEDLDMLDEEMEFYAWAAESLAEGAG